MKRLLLIVALLGASLPAAAQEAPQLSVVQQYLYNDTGYAPPVQQAPAPEQPYDTAAMPADSVEEDPYYATQDHLNEGVSGMNF